MVNERFNQIQCKALTFMFLEKRRIGIEMVSAGRILGGSHDILADET